MDVGASYIAIGMRFTLIWGSVALIAWAVLRILQQTSSATLIIKPSETPAEETTTSEFAGQGHLRSNSIHDDYGDYILEQRGTERNAATRGSYIGQTTGQYGGNSGGGNVVSSAASIYSSVTTSSGYSANTNASSLYYSPPTPQYNPYSGGSASPGRAASPTRVSVPSRKPNSGGSPTMLTAPGSPGKPVLRRLEPRIVPVDESVVFAGADDAYRPYGPAGGAYSRKSPDVVLEKPVGQSAFRIRRGA